MEHSKKSLTKSVRAITTEKIGDYFIRKAMREKNMLSETPNKNFDRETFAL